MSEIQEWMREAVTEINFRNRARGHVLKSRNGEVADVMPAEEMIEIIARNFAAHVPQAPSPTPDTHCRVCGSYSPSVRLPFPFVGTPCDSYFHDTTPSPAQGEGQPEPYTYAHRYPDGIRFGTNGRTINGNDPIEAIPLYLHSGEAARSGREPEPTRDVKGTGYNSVGAGAETQGAREELAKWFFDNEADEQEESDRKHKRILQKYARWPEDAAIQPYCRWAFKRADAFIAKFGDPSSLRQQVKEANRIIRDVLMAEKTATKRYEENLHRLERAEAEVEGLRRQVADLSRKEKALLNLGRPDECEARAALEKKEGR